ncbi:MAG: hypothetical protein RPU91_13925 [Candidatus Sedimenticola sp. (ex Thyasira tokunagai)]
MSNNTIRRNLIDAINEMTQLLEACNDADQKFKIRIKIRELFHELDKVIVATLDSGTDEFKEALKSLKELTKQAKEARDDLEKVAKTINKAAKAIGKVEKLVKGVVGVIAVL